MGLSKWKFVLIIFKFLVIRINQTADFVEMDEDDLLKIVDQFLFLFEPLKLVDALFTGVV